MILTMKIDKNDFYCKNALPMIFTMKMHCKQFFL